MNMLPADLLLWRSQPSLPELVPGLSRHHSVSIMNTMHLANERLECDLSGSLWMMANRSCFSPSPHIEALRPFCLQCVDDGSKCYPAV